MLAITTADLVRLGACAEGVEAFREIYGDGACLKWTREGQISVMKSPLRRYLGWAVCNGLVPWWSLPRSDLSGCNLSGCNLSGSDLSGSNLSGSNLSGSDLSGCNLSGCNLSGCNLRSSRVCLCETADCVRLRLLVANAGWVPDNSARLIRTPKGDG